MGADYYIYAEIKRKDGTWRALNGQYYNESTDKYELSETFHSGSRTYFAKTYNKLRELGAPISFRELSPDVLAKENWLIPEDDENDDFDDIIAVSLNSLRNSVPKTNRRQCCGYVQKSHIWYHEVEGEEIDCYLTAEEYNELSEAEKREYEFYEWDDATDWPLNLKEILSIVNFQIRAYMDINNMWNEPTDIRIVCIASY